MSEDQFPWGERVVPCCRSGERCTGRISRTHAQVAQHPPTEPNVAYPIGISLVGKRRLVCDGPECWRGYVG